MILVSGKPFIEDPKLLGIPVISRSTGTAQIEAVINLLKDWNCLDVTIALVFDTTASNTGRQNGAVIGIEKHLNKSLLWLACRHHVYEVHIKHVSDAITAGARNSPSEGIFLRFQKEWSKFNIDVSVTAFV